MFAKLFKTEKKTQAPRTGRVIPLSDANLEQVAGGISGQVSGAHGTTITEFGGTA